MDSLTSYPGQKKDKKEWSARSLAEFWQEGAKMRAIWGTKRALLAQKICEKGNNGII